MRLMVVIALVINVFLALSLVFFQATRKTYPGFGLWTTGVSLLGLGYLSLCLRGLIPDSISILVVNAAFPLGMVLHLAGMRRFLGTNSHVAAMVRSSLGELSRLRRSFTTDMI